MTYISLWSDSSLFSKIQICLHRLIWLPVSAVQTLLKIPLSHIPIFCYIYLGTTAQISDAKKLENVDCYLPWYRNVKEWYGCYLILKNNKRIAVSDLLFDVREHTLTEMVSLSNSMYFLYAFLCTIQHNSLEKDI